MYGLLLDSIQKFLCGKYGERYWDAIRRRANLKNQWFVTHEVYSDGVLIELVEAAAAELGEDRDMVMRMFGEYFTQNIGHYGYARLLRVLGRDLRDFLNGLDDLHEYLRFSYPKMSPPSFFCESETEKGLILHYTTKRRGFLEYVIGQLTSVGLIYGKELEIVVLTEERTETSTHFIMELKFDNRELLQLKEPSPMEKQFSIDIETFLSVFPFCVFFDKDLLVWKEGAKLAEVLPGLCGKHLQECFSIHKPLFDTLSWKVICLHANCVFELVSTVAVDRRTHLPDMDYLVSPPQLRLKGQMMVLSQIEAIAFLCSPVMDGPEELYESGIYVNDLAMHDSSRDIILAGSQKDPELKIALSQEKIRSAQLEESIQQTDRLLFQMIPKPIADQLRNGETPLNTCREFSSVSILFSDIVSFTPMCSRLHPMEVVCVLNTMYVAFDRLCKVHHVYKLETIGDAYMVICGAPVYTIHHAEYITDFGLAAIQATSKINDPSTDQSLRIRVGVHSGNVVAGVVGSTILRYDVFGDTVNVAARMEATGEPMRVHISEAMQKLLIGSLFDVQPRGSVEVKGKGKMDTFWVNGKTNESDAPVDSAILPLSRTSPTKHGIPLDPSKSPLPSFSPPCALNRSRPPLSPKPNEWPRAEQQFRKFSSDHSVPPTRRYTMTVPSQAAEPEESGRRNTLAVITPGRETLAFMPPGGAETVADESGRGAGINTVASVPANLTQYQSQDHAHISLSHVNSKLWTQHQLMEQQLGRLLLTDIHEGVEQGTHPPSQAGSEFMTMHLPGDSSNSPSPPDADSALLAEMEHFAAQAEKGARQAEINAKEAQELADRASSIVNMWRVTGNEATSAGTSVDPIQPYAMVDSTTSPVEQDNPTQPRCPIDQPTPQSNGCTIM